MDEEKIKKHIALMESCKNLDLHKDPEILDGPLEELYLALYDLRRQVDEIVEKLPLPLLARLARALQALIDNRENLGGEIEEELDMFMFYENFDLKVEEQRKLSWDELLKQ